jgi:hypothetical protein
LNHDTDAKAENAMKSLPETPLGNNSVASLDAMAVSSSEQP